MLIICPSCVSAYRIRLDPLAPPPTVARCAQCRRSFPITASPESASSSGVPALAEGPVAAAPHRPVPIGPAALHGFRPARAPRPPAPAAVPREGSGAGILAMAVIVVGIGMAGVAMRQHLIDAAPATAPWFEAMGLAPDRGLSLRDVQTVVAAEGNTKVLTLEGRITNERKSQAAVPDLRIVVRDAAAQSVYSWTTPAPRASLAPGEGVAFRSRLVAPPNEGHDIVVSFADTDRTGSVTVKDKR